MRCHRPEQWQVRDLRGVDPDSVRTAKVTTAFIKRCRTVLTERRRYITK
jgi:hypothetical protein